MIRIFAFVVPLCCLLTASSMVAQEKPPTKSDDPAETKPAETKPVESQPAESKPAEADPAETKTAETKTAETKTAANGEKPAATEKPAGESGEVESGPLAGHSNHGEIFNEGPRQKAYLMPGMANVDFPITSKSEEVQQFFNQGVSQLHGFWFFESERSFRHAASLEPDCAMLYWGMAMSNMSNSKRAKGFIEEAKKRRESASPREQKYIDALHAFLNADTSSSDKKKARAEKYIKALERILYDYPDDTEAKAFLALEFWKRRSDGVKIYSYHAVDALLGEVFDANPMHPAHHYRIHLWDSERPQKALASAATCGQTTPGIAHMWHMPGHIFSRLKRYDDAVFQQEASARVDHAHMMRDRVLPDQIHNYAHNNEWLIRNLIFVGRAEDAVNLAKNMIELPRHPKYNHLARRGCSSSYGRARLFQVLEAFELWQQTIQLCDTPYLEATDIPREQANRLRALGRAHLRLGNREAGQAVIEQLQQKSTEQAEKRDAEIAKAIEEIKEEDEAKRKVAMEKAKKDKTREYASTIGEFDRARGELEGWLAVLDGDAKGAIEKLKKARVSGPALAHVYQAAGETDKAQAEIDKYLPRHKNEVVPLAHAVRLAMAQEKTDEAKKHFSELRKLSAHMDLSAPVFAPLAEWAVQWGHAADWRVEPQLADDIGDRPSLDSLGPFRWQPSPAPPWALEGVDGKKVTLQDYEGKPVVLIFFLGYGCLHCAEQLHAFAPKVEEFREAGFEVLAISSDNHDGLKKSLANYDGGPLPIPLCADPKLEAFQAYRAVDNFEEMPLHGTFVIDCEGLIRWQDISYEPFMDPDFVLKEAQRLLASE